MRIVIKVIFVLLRFSTAYLGGLLASLSYYLLRFNVYIATKEFPDCESLKTTQDRLQSLKPCPPIQNDMPGESVAQGAELDGLPTIDIMTPGRVSPGMAKRIQASL